MSLHEDQAIDSQSNHQERHQKSRPQTAMNERERQRYNVAFSNVSSDAISENGKNQLNNYQQDNEFCAERYSPHYAHHAALKKKQDIEKLFNYTGSHFLTPNHNPAMKVQALLQSSQEIDPLGNANEHSIISNKICDSNYTHGDCSNNHFGSPRNESQNKKIAHSLQKPVAPTKGKQPYGSGEYSNQLILRTPQSKKGIKFETQKRNLFTQQERSRFSHTQSNFSSVSFKSGTKNQSNQDKLKQQLYMDDKTKAAPKSTVKNGVIEDIASQGDKFVENKELMKSILKLKDLDLLKEHEVYLNAYPGVGKSPYVINDYHQKATKNGYSRNEKGGFFYTS